MQLKRVVVTGLGALTPIGNSLKEYWKALSDGVSGAAPITLFDASKFKTTFACEVKGFDPQDYFDRKEARKLDRFAQFAVVASDQAIKDAQITEAIDHNRIGVIWGSGIGGLITFHHQVSEFALGDGTPRYNPFFIPKMISDIASGHISIKHGFKGPNFTTVSACASSTHALIDAFNYIRLGKADIIVSGGSEAAVNQSGIGGFNAMKALSTRNESPESASRPFDVSRDGFVLGEGAGALVLEEREHALKRGAKIYAEVVGAGLTADAYHLSAPHPEGPGITEVMKQAIDEAKISPSLVDYVNVHGTSTPLGDVVETKAIENVFGQEASKLNISATKSMTGHLLGAAGAIEALACVMALNKGVIPPTINNTQRDPAINPDLNLTLNKAQHRDVQYALSNTFGFGGHNASILLKKAKQT